MKQYNSTAEKIVVEYLAPAMKYLLLPFQKAVTAVHNTIGRVLTFILPDGGQVTYQPWQNRYIISTEWWGRGEPDQYQVGHFSGRISIVLGLVPVLLGIALAKLFSWFAPSNPQSLMASVFVIVAGVVLPIFVAVALLGMFYLGVDYQPQFDTEQT